VEVAVVETAPEDILREGLAFDRCQVGVVVGSLTGAGPALAERVVVAAVARDGAAVLNADDPRVAELAAATGGEVVYYSLASHNPLVSAHRARGGRCVFMRGDQIVLAQGRTLTALLDVSRVGLTAARALSSFSAAARTVTAAASTGSGYVQMSERTRAGP
jgi:cyanophycin synthetase